MKKYEMDDFEKLYITVAAKLNSPKQVSSVNFKDEDFKKVCTLAKYKLEHSEQFEMKNKIPSIKDESHYIIPITLNQRVRNNQETILEKKEAFILTDSDGYGVCTILGNGQVVHASKRFQAARDINEVSMIIDKEHGLNREKGGMSYEERQRYITEIGEINKRLEDAIEEYQKHSTHENWENVKVAMNVKVELERKYNISKGNKKVSVKTLEETKKQILDEKEDDSEEWFHGPKER